jgi:hypothetical protein
MALDWWPIYPDWLPSVDRRRGAATTSQVLAYVSVTELRVSQLPVEVAWIYTEAYLRVSQIVVELAWIYTQAYLRVSQVIVEIAYPFGCYSPIPPPDSGGVVACPAGIPESAVTAPPACPVELPVG